MNIVLSANNNYAPHLAVTITSILSNCAKDDEFKFFIFNNDFSDDTKNKILDVKKIKNCEITFFDLSEDDFDFLPTRIHYKKQIYYRLKIPEYINAKRALYLDSDIIVRKSLKDFYNIDLKNNVIAAAEDITSNEYKKNFNLEKYFNSGVLLIDIEKAKEEDILKKCINFTLENKEKSLFYDQDALNCILKDKVLFTDLKYNFQVNKDYKKIRSLYKKYKKEICILHFVSGDKPWNFGCDGNFIAEYFYYIFKTPFLKSSIAKNLRLLKELISHYI